MTRAIGAWLPRVRRLFVRRDRQPGAALFTGIRLRLTLWYSAVLAVALVLFGGVLYGGVHQALFAPVDAALTRRVAQLSTYWQRCPGMGPRCRPRARGAGLTMGQYWVFYDAGGSVTRASTVAQFSQGFINPSLARAALTSGPARDTAGGGVDAAGVAVGPIRRYAVAVPDPNGVGFLGVVQVGTPVQQEIDAQHGFLMLLLVAGVLTLAATTFGGLFLAYRALAPARLAFTRQQRFIADASHELRTPLTLLRADAEVLLRGRERLLPDDATLLEDIVAETAHMSELAANMLTLARLDAGRFHLERDVVDLAAVAAVVARRAAALAGEAGVALEVETARPALVLGDRALLEQAALILLDNAVKYNKAGGRVTVRACQQDGHSYLEVSDSGIGIPPEHLARLGEPFYRVDKVRSRDDGGAGLGIAIARDVAAAHGGALTLASQPGHGTTATLALPAARQISC